jgi:hypothetical protein
MDSLMDDLTRKMRELEAQNGRAYHPRRAELR